jgi:aminoglycoside phosphotransferase (APT) family kinase protein
VHAGNVFYADGGTRGGLLDWQLSLRGNWSLDVGYIVQTALTPEQRGLHERELLRGYLARLGALGVPAVPTFDDAWLRYRQSAIAPIREPSPKMWCEDSHELRQRHNDADTCRSERQ